MELMIGQVRVDPDTRVLVRKVKILELNTHSRFGIGVEHARVRRGNREVRIKMSTLRKWAVDGSGE